MFSSSSGNPVNLIDNWNPADAYGSLPETQYLPSILLEWSPFRLEPCCCIWTFGIWLWVWAVLRSGAVRSSALSSAGLPAFAVYELAGWTRSSPVAANPCGNGHLVSHCFVWEPLRLKWTKTITRMHCSRMRTVRCSIRRGVGRGWGGVSTQEGRGVCPSAFWDTPPLWTESQTPVKT